MTGDDHAREGRPDAEAGPSAASPARPMDRQANEVSAVTRPQALPRSRPIETGGLLHQDPPVFELGAPGRSGASLPALDVPARDPFAALPPHLVRQAPPGLPEISEVEATRHYTRL